MLEHIILKTLQKSPNDRYADMQVLVDTLKAALNEPVPAGLPVSAEPHTQEAVQEEESSVGRLFSPFKKIFGGGKKEEKSKKHDTASRTAPREQLTVSANDDDDEMDSTVRLNLKNQTKTTPRIMLQNGKVTLELPHKDSIIIGRTYRDTVVDLDLEPYEASKHGLSRRHSRLVKQGDAWLIEDLGSLNGTFVNDTQIKQGRPVTLKEGDRVRLSHLTFVFFP